MIVVVIVVVVVVVFGSRSRSSTRTCKGNSRESVCVLCMSFRGSQADDVGWRGREERNVKKGGAGEGRRQKVGKGGSEEDTLSYHQ